MADTKVSDEAAATTPTGAELVRVVQGGSSKQTTLAVMGHQFRGARARMSADDTTQNITGSDTAISFDVADFDTDSFWSAGAPTRLTIPAGLGIAYVELTGQVHVALSTGDTTFLVSIYHNNSAGTPLRLFGPRFVEMGGGTKCLVASTGPVAVTAGDYFELRAREETDTSVTIEGDSTIQTFLALTVIGMVPV